MLRLSAKTEYTVFKTPGGQVKLYRHGGEVRICLHYSGAYGMGEKYDALNQKGKTVVNRVEEKFCFQGDKTYCTAPFFWTDTGFGLYADTCEVTSFRFDDSEIIVMLPNYAEIVLFTGRPEQIIREYMSLFGKAVLPPDWAFGPWISANRWNTQAEAEAQIEKLKASGFPASVLVLEAWSDEATFYLWNGADYTPLSDGKALSMSDLSFREPWPDPKSMIDKLHEAGLHLLLWQVPVYKKQGEEEMPNRQNDLDREDAVRRGLCVHNADGSPYTIPEGHWFSGSMIPDFTNPETRNSWFAKRTYLLEMGVDGFKTDGGEFVYREDLRFHDGSTGREGVNRYARDYEQSYRCFLGESRILFSRAGYAGQHTVPLHWAGDQQSQNSELKSALHAGLSAAASGILFWGFDLAGFAGPLPSLDLYRRATQMACFCPVMQWHSEPDGGQFKELMPGGEGNNERSPWNMAAAYNAPEFMEEMRFWHRLRMKLLPYIQKTARQCVEESQPMMRPLAYEWPDDPNAVNCEDEYLFGEAMLIAPLLEENAEDRTVYLPEGHWIDFFTCKQYDGRQRIRAGGNGKLPVFVRAGYDDLLKINIYD